MTDERTSELTSEFPPQIPTYKVIVVGDSGVGKTCLTFRFCSGHFPSTATDATIGVDFALKVINWDNETVIRLQLWDIAGQVSKNTNVNRYLNILHK